jgi:hypothetical protein
MENKVKQKSNAMAESVKREMGGRVFKITF